MARRGNGTGARESESLGGDVVRNCALVARTFCRYINLAGWPRCRGLRAVKTVADGRDKQPDGS